MKIRNEIKANIRLLVDYSLFMLASVEQYEHKWNKIVK